MRVYEIIENGEKNLPIKMKSAPWTALNHGIDPLQSEDQLNAYLSAYGEIHYIKCRAAFQNFPFDRLYSYEIYDWGCGQGIATLTLIEMLMEREKLFGLRKITIIEPSEPAINRAKEYIRQIVPNVRIHCVNKYIPSETDAKELDEITPYDGYAIHIFSNVLDIPSINLKWLANKVSTLGTTLFIACIGPTNAKSHRIVDFCQYFNATEFFSKIDEPQYSRTSKTKHTFSCRSRCFEYHSIDNNIDNAFKEHSYCKEDYIDDYSYGAEIMRNVLGDGIIDLYHALCSKITQDDSIYLRPFIGIDNPDIILLRPQYGIAIFGVCRDVHNIDDECERLDNYKNNLINLHLKELKAKTILNTTFVSIIKTILLVPNSNIKIDTNKHKYITTIAVDDINSIDLLQVIGLNRSNNFYTSSIHEDIYKTLNPEKWHSYRDGDQNIKLTNNQKELIISKPGRQKIKGVAGCGKTQVLVSRAVNAQVRTGGKILILTFNLTLANYIKYRLGQIHADFSWSQFHITNYHQFFKSQANNYCPPLSKPTLYDWDNSSFFDSVKNSTTKYDSILIDEAQDFKYEWFDILQKYFLKESGEFVVFADGAQNIFKHNQYDNNRLTNSGIVHKEAIMVNEEYNLPRVPKISGGWKTLKSDKGKNKSFRMENPEILRLASAFQKDYFIISDPLEEIPTNLSFGNLKYWNIGITDYATLCSNIRWIFQEYKIKIEETVLLSQNCSKLREIEHFINIQQGTITTFETKEQYDTLNKKLKDDPNYTNEKFNQDIESIRKVKKIHFTMDNPGLKMSTIHSFKGWESKNVILLVDIDSSTTLMDLDNDSDPYIIGLESQALIYTAITRAKENLFILNLGNFIYDNFFTKHIKQ